MNYLVKNMMFDFVNFIHIEVIKFLINLKYYMLHQ